jgi:hypothetical protein
VQGIIALQLSWDETLLAVHHARGVDVHHVTHFMSGNTRPLRTHCADNSPQQFEWRVRLRRLCRSCSAWNSRRCRAHRRPRRAGSFLTVSKDGVLSAWDPAAPTPETVLADNDVSAAAWSPDGALPLRRPCTRVRAPPQATHRCVATGTAVAFVSGRTVSVCTTSSDCLASLEVPDTEEAWDGRDFALHSVRWTPDSDDAGSAPEFSGTLPPGCLLLGVTLGPLEEGEDWEADFMEASPVIALRWNPDGANAARMCTAALRCR